MSYVFIKSDPNKSNGENLHIFEATKNTLDNWVKKSESLCGIIEWKNTGNILYTKDTHNEVRELATYLQNRKINVCANCIRKFYKDENIKKKYLNT